MVLDHNDCTKHKFVIGAVTEAQVKNDEGITWYFDSKEFDSCDIEDLCVECYLME